MKFRQIKETCFYAHDLETVKDFYHRVLGLPIIGEVSNKHIFFRAGSSVLLCFNPDDSRTKTSPPAHGALGKFHFAFEVDTDVYEETKREVVTKGISITEEISWPRGGQSFYFEDPLGNVLEILPSGVIWD
jgi:catechol 2,3-dioxygenase-like lactoylglutathione lyase family enzyme